MDKLRELCEGLAIIRSVSCPLDLPKGNQGSEEMPKAWIASGVVSKYY